jgi:hypothetical protein
MIFPQFPLFQARVCSAKAKRGGALVSTLIGNQLFRSLHQRFNPSPVQAARLNLKKCKRPAYINV